MTDTEISIDIERIRELVEEYAESQDRQEQRDIENAVLFETVWQTLPENRNDQLALNEEQVEIIRNSLPEGADRADRILKRLYIQRL
jgi:hypothetical protein